MEDKFAHLKMHLFQQICVLNIIINVVSLLGGIYHKNKTPNSPQGKCIWAYGIIIRGVSIANFLLHKQEQLPKGKITLLVFQQHVCSNLDWPEIIIYLSRS